MIRFVLLGTSVSVFVVWDGRCSKISSNSEEINWEATLKQVKVSSHLLCQDLKRFPDWEMFSLKCYFQSGEQICSSFNFGLTED